MREAVRQHVLTQLLTRVLYISETTPLGAVQTIPNPVCKLGIAPTRVLSIRTLCFCRHKRLSAVKLPSG